MGQDLPFWTENSAGGGSLRGFVHRQFAGDTQLRTQVEYHFPLFSIRKLDVRGLLFNDATAIWYRELPAARRHRHGATWSAPTAAASCRRIPDRRVRCAKRDVHTSVGAGLRFFLRSVAVPLVGVDVGYGLPDGPVRVLIVIGA